MPWNWSHCRFPESQVSQMGGERDSLELCWAGGELLDVQDLRKKLQVAIHEDREPLKILEKWPRESISFNHLPGLESIKPPTPNYPPHSGSSLPVLHIDWCGVWG